MGKGDQGPSHTFRPMQLGHERSPAPPSYKSVDLVPSASRHVQAPRGHLSKHVNEGFLLAAAGSFSSTTGGVGTAQNIL